MGEVVYEHRLRSVLDSAEMAYFLQEAIGSEGLGLWGEDALTDVGDIVEIAEVEAYFCNC